MPGSQEAPRTDLDLGHYVALLDLAYEAAQVLEGTPPPYPWIADCQQLAAKLYFHAATVHWLRHNGTRCPVPGPMATGSHFFDFASVQVIARSVLETYLTMFEVFFEPTGDDERSFRHAHWQLSGLVVREGLLFENTVSLDRVFQSQQEIETLRERIRNTSRFASLTPKQQAQVLEGRKLNRSRADLAKAAGFSEDLLGMVYSYQSGYVHADGLSGMQIMASTTQEEQIRFIDSSMRVAIMPSLSKMILSYATTFPQARAVCERHANAFWWARLYSESARLLKLKRIPFFED